MTNTYFEHLVNRIIDEALTSKEIRRLLDKATSSGAIDVEAIPDDDFTMAKATAYVIAKTLAEQLRPLSRTTLAEVRNLEKFI